MSLCVVVSVCVLECSVCEEDMGPLEEPDLDPLWEQSVLLGVSHC